MNADFLKELLSLLMTTEVSLPAIEVSFLLLTLTCCLVFKLSKTGVVVAYILTYRWGWVYFADQQERYLIAYLVFGLIVGVLSVVGMMMSPHK